MAPRSAALLIAGAVGGSYTVLLWPAQRSFHHGLLGVVPEVAERPDMQRFVYPAVLSLIHHAPIGSGECTALAQYTLPGNTGPLCPHLTTEWRPGEKVKGNVSLPTRTLIALFHGQHYVNKHGGLAHRAVRETEPRRHRGRPPILGLSRPRDTDSVRWQQDTRTPFGGIVSQPSTQYRHARR